MKNENEVANALYNLRASIADPNVEGGKDAAGGYVNCLTEAVMGNTAGLMAIANAISDLAEAIRETEY